MQNEMRDWLVRRLNDWGTVKSEALADYLLANGVIVPPCKVGDTVYMVIAGDFDLFISKEKVTEVGSKGFHISDFFPPKDDIGDFISYESIGKNVFLTYEEADKAIEERGSNNATH
jgi:hypothetical protein